MQNKNLKLKLGLCGLALTSFLALNAHSVVRADTVSDSNANNNAITWNSDSDDSQVVKEEPQQEKVSQSVQKQVSAQSQPVQNKKIMVSDVSSTVRQSNAQTSTVNRLNANQSQANIKVSNVQDVAQAPVQKQKVAQFNQGSKIYTLNGSNQLSKNNGDGYVITNAGTYNGRKVDIGVTINNVQDNQGTYTTKWSNGDKANVTGKTDANFKYQDSVLLNQQVTDPNLTQTRSRTETQNVQNQLNGVWIKYDEAYSAGGVDQNAYVPTLIDPKLIADTMTLLKCDEPHAVYALLTAKDLITLSGINLGNYNYFLKRKWNYHYTDDFGPYVNTKYFKADRGFYDDNTSSQSFDNPWYDAGRSKFIHYNLVQPNVTVTSDNFVSTFWRNSDVTGEVMTGTVAKNKKGKLIATQLDDLDVYSDPYHNEASANEINSILSHISPNGYKFTMSKDVQVTDHLQVDSSTPASLGYNYTVGLYDAQTGDLITDLKAEYNSKAGVQATAKDSVMNNAIKSKIQQINQNKAQVSYTGTRANDDVAFYKETRAVNPQDQALHKSATRIISVNLPDDPAVKKRYKDILNSNNQIVQTINFTRTGTENIVSGQVTYGAWQGPSSFSAVTLPDIPGYTMTMD